METEGAGDVGRSDGRGDVMCVHGRDGDGSFTGAARSAMICSMLLAVQSVGLTGRSWAATSVLRYRQGAVAG